MRLLSAFLVSCALVVLTYVVPADLANAQPENTAGSSADPAAESLQQPAPRGTQASAPQKSPDGTIANVRAFVTEHWIFTLSIVVVALLLVIGVGIMLFLAKDNPRDPYILKLGPSFFFWLGTGYMGLLLLLALAYNLSYESSRPYLVGGVLPLAVPWFGALGAVSISLEGVFGWSKTWDEKYNYWHIGRPLFGAVLGIVAFFLYVLIITASGTPPKILETQDPNAVVSAKDFIIFYIVAFLVGYREETFRELIRRVTDLILKPGAQTTAPPTLTFKIAGVATSTIEPPPIRSTQTSRVTVEVQNSGTAPLIAPVVAVSVTAPTPAGTFAIANDLVTGGGDLAPNQARTVDVTFTPPTAGNFSGNLTVTATNLVAPSTIPISGTGQ